MYYLFLLKNISHGSMMFNPTTLSQNLIEITVVDFYKFCVAKIDIREQICISILFGSSAVDGKKFLESIASLIRGT